jgi:hypothetical protein
MLTFVNGGTGTPGLCSEFHHEDFPKRFIMSFPKEFQKWNNAIGNFCTNNCGDIRFRETTA